MRNLLLLLFLCLGIHFLQAQSSLMTEYTPQRCSHPLLRTQGFEVRSSLSLANHRLASLATSGRFSYLAVTQSLQKRPEIFRAWLDEQTQIINSKEGLILDMRNLDFSRAEICTPLEELCKNYPKDRVILVLTREGFTGCLCRELTYLKNAIILQGNNFNIKSDAILKKALLKLRHSFSPKNVSIFG